MRARGYDVTANAAPAGLTDNKDPDILEKWKTKDGEAVSEDFLPATSGQAAYDELVSRVKSWGNGGRGFVVITYKSGGGHIFNVENRNGKVRFIESQTNQANKGTDWIQNVRWTSPFSNWTLRTDNLVPQKRIMTWVRQRTDGEVRAPSEAQLGNEFKARGWSTLDLEALAFKQGWYAVRTGQKPNANSYVPGSASETAYNDGVNWARSF